MLIVVRAVGIRGREWRIGEGIGRGIKEEVRGRGEGKEGVEGEGIKLIWTAEPLGQFET